jgi:hypothetical protein
MQNRWVSAIGVLAGYAVVAAMGVALLGLALSSMDNVTESRAAWAVAGVLAFLTAAVAAVTSVRYELVASSPQERIGRHLRMQGASLGILAIAVLLVLVWSWVPAPVHVVAASAGSGFVLGFLGAFIPNRRRALEIRDIDHAP